MKMKNFKLILQKSLLNKKVAESYLNPALHGLFLAKMMFLGQKRTFHFFLGALYPLATPAKNENYVFTSKHQFRQK